MMYSEKKIEIETKVSKSKDRVYKSKGYYEIGFHFVGTGVTNIEGPLSIEELKTLRKQLRKLIRDESH